MESPNHQHGARLYRNLYIFRISRLRKTAVTWILARVFECLPSFLSQIPDLIYWTVSIFILIWRDTKHQKFKAGLRDHFSCQAPGADGKGTILSLDHFWKPTKFSSKNNTSKDIVIKNIKYCKCKQAQHHKFPSRGKFSSWQKSQWTWLVLIQFQK